LKIRARAFDDAGFTSRDRQGAGSKRKPDTPALHRLLPVAARKSPEIADW
jgi:hypothetical protein